MSLGFCRIYGAPSLKTLATEAVNRKLEATLKELIQKEELSASRQRRPSELVISAAMHDGGHSSHPYGGSSAALMAAAVRRSSNPCSPSAADRYPVSSPLHPATPGIDPPSVPGGPPRPSPRGTSLDSTTTPPRNVGRAAEEGFSLPGMVHEEDEAGAHDGARAMPLFTTTEIDPLSQRQDVEASWNENLSLAAPVHSVAAHDDDITSPRTPIAVSSAEACYRPYSDKNGQHPEKASHAVLDMSSYEGKIGSEEDDAVHLMNSKFPGVAKEAIGAADEVQDDECGVCLESVPGVMVMPCNHQLCGEIGSKHDESVLTEIPPVAFHQQPCLCCASSQVPVRSRSAHRTSKSLHCVHSAAH